MVGEILMFEALTAPEPKLTLDPLITTSDTAVNVAVVLLIAPLVKSSMFPEVVWSDLLIVRLDVLTEDPIVIADGFWANEC